MPRFWSETFYDQNDNKFAVEWDWNTQTSQKVGIFFENSDGILKKNLKLFKLIKGGKFAV